MTRFKEMLRKVWLATQQHGRVALAGGGLFLLAFLLGTYLFFPLAAVQQRLVGELEARTPINVQIDKLSLSPLLTLRTRQAIVTFDNSAMTPIVLTELRLKPLWTSLLTGNPGVTIDVALPQGRLAADWQRGGELAMHAEGLKLTDLPIDQEARTLLSGTIIKGELRGVFPSRKTAETLLAAEIDTAALTVMGQPLALGKVSLQGSGQGNNLRIATLTANGGDVAITGSGSLLLGASMAASRVNLDLTLRPTAATPGGIAALLDLAAKHQADGSYRLRLSGSPGQLTAEPAAPAAERRTEPTNDDDE